jgi:hypothetical protein
VAKRKVITVHVAVSVPEGVTKQDVKREIKARVNDGCCYSLEQEDVKVRSIM